MGAKNVKKFIKNINFYPFKNLTTQISVYFYYIYFLISVSGAFVSIFL